MKNVLFAFAVLALGSATALADKEFNGDKNITWDCGKDPVVTISSSNAKVAITGTCKGVTLTGNGVTMTIDTTEDLTFTGRQNKFTIANVKDITLNGDENTLGVGTLGDITVNGNKNAVTWKKAKSGKEPGVQDNGSKNAVAKEKK